MQHIVPDELVNLVARPTLGIRQPLDERTLCQWSAIASLSNGSDGSAPPPLGGIANTSSPGSSRGMRLVASTVTVARAASSEDTSS
jgi:hypothetical protein